MKVNINALNNILNSETINIEIKEFIINAIKYYFKNNCSDNTYSLLLGLDFFEIDDNDDDDEIIPSDLKIFNYYELQKAPKFIIDTVLKIESDYLKKDESSYKGSDFYEEFLIGSGIAFYYRDIKRVTRKNKLNQIQQNEN